MEDRELIRAATFGIVLEAYRLEPTQPEAAALVAAVLQDLGLAEASPAVLVEATRAHPDARTVSGALTIALRAMGLELEADDADAVRRTYAAAAPLLKIAEQKALAPDAATERCACSGDDGRGRAAAGGPRGGARAPQLVGGRGAVRRGAAGAGADRPPRRGGQGRARRSPLRRRCARHRKRSGAARRGAPPDERSRARSGGRGRRPSKRSSMLS